MEILPGEGTARMAGVDLTVLIIEDSPEDREAYRRFLDRQPGVAYTILEAETAAEGLEVLKTREPDCILLDYELPGSNGLAFLQEIADEEGRPRYPVIMLTGRGDERVAVEAMKAGACDYVVKGEVDAGLLGRSVQYAIGRREKEEALREAERLRVVLQTVGAAAHEINQPLTAILGTAELLLYQVGEKPGIQKDLKVIFDSAKRIGRIVNKMRATRRYVTKAYMEGVDILDFERGSEGGGITEGH